MSKKESKKFGALLLLSIPAIIVVFLVLSFIVLISPMLVVGFLGYVALNTINDIHRRNKNYKLKNKENGLNINRTFSHV